MSQEHDQLKEQLADFHLAHAAYRAMDGYTTELEQLVKDYSDYVDSLPLAFLTPLARMRREQLQERTGELLEGKERA